MTNLTTDAGIPLLTEVIPSPSPASAMDTSPAPAAMAPLSAEEELVTIDAPQKIGLDEEQLRLLENDIRERVLMQVLERIDFVLEQRVRDSLADVLQTAVGRLADEIRSGLHQSIRDVVTRAVSQEITRLQATRK